MHRSKTVFASLTIALFLFATQAHAKFDKGLVNASFGNKDSVPSGKAVLGADNDKWNGMDGAMGENVALTDSTGAKTDVAVTFAAEATWDSDEAGFIGTPYEKLLRHYLFTKEARKVKINGLTPDTKYDLILYSASNREDRKTKFTIGKESKTTSYVLDKKELTEGTNYAKFTVAADAAGAIVVEYEGTGDDTEGNLNGFQISPAK